MIVRDNLRGLQRERVTPIRLSRNETLAQPGKTAVFSHCGRPRAESRSSLVPQPCAIALRYRVSAERSRGSIGRAYLSISTPAVLVRFATSSRPHESSKLENVRKISSNQFSEVSEAELHDKCQCPLRERKRLPPLEPSVGIVSL